MIIKLIRYYNTLKHLKCIQLYYQVWYRLRSRIWKPKYSEVENYRESLNVHLTEFPFQHEQFNKSNTFTFLNLTHRFSDEINWEFEGYGKLWTYHLNYFEYLNQKNIDQETGLSLIQKFLEKPVLRLNGFEPYPNSLRIINWVKFYSRFEIQDNKLLNQIEAHANLLLKTLEYHLLANHLIENGFALLFAAVATKNSSFGKSARKILIRELDEQILQDGAHYELSPMYHLIILQRVLDSINLLNNNQYEYSDIKIKLIEKAELMVAWIQEMKFANGDLPDVNDCTKGQSLDLDVLLEYAQSLGIKIKSIKLLDSGYRKMKNENFELLIDVGDIGPSYQPGHAHSDTLSFILYSQQKPVIVDRGISTYEKNEIRKSERSTESHNTVMINELEQSDVWGGFRVSKRAKATIHFELDNHIQASHNGYKSNGFSHVREWMMDNGSITILDVIKGNPELVQAHFHFHPDVFVEKQSKSVVKIDNLILSFQGLEKLEFNEYGWSAGFNKRISSNKLTVTFSKKLETSIMVE